LIYIDGTSAGKTSMGTLDTQDLILRNSSNGTATWGDYERAQDLCSLSSSLGIELEGFIRMEAGFELILCDFENGLEFVEARQRPDPDSEKGAWTSGELMQFEYMRGVSARYHGITGGRVSIDYSHMVSAYFYPINLTNPDVSKSELPRIDSGDEKGLKVIKEDLKKLLKKSREEGHRNVDWQGVVDMIVSRYSDRLQFLAGNESSHSVMRSEVNIMLNVFIDYKELDTEITIEKCASHYLTPAIPETASDYLIQEAVLTVSRRICSSLFEVRGLLHDDEEDKKVEKRKEGKEVVRNTVSSAKKVVRDLIEYLGWSTWLECGKCAYDEVCFVAIWPFGGVQDHVAPGCVKNEGLRTRTGYWDMRG